MSGRAQLCDTDVVANYKRLTDAGGEVIIRGHDLEEWLSLITARLMETGADKNDEILAKMLDMAEHAGCVFQRAVGVHMEAEGEILRGIKQTEGEVRQ